MNSELANLLAARGGYSMIDPSVTQNLPPVFAVLAKRAASYGRVAQTRLYNLRPRTVEFGFIKDYSLNALAYATRVDENPAFDFIGLNIGTPMTLMTIFQNMLSRRDVLADVGDIGLEREDVPLIEFLSPNVIRDQIALIVPRCPVRELFASELTVTACDFFYFHELAHLKNGHIELWRERSGATSIVEMNSAISRDNARIRRALETHADFGGAEGTLRCAFNSRETLLSQHDLDPEKLRAGLLLYGTPFLATQLVIFSIYVVLRLFREEIRAQFVQAETPYPSPAVRFSSVMRSLMTYYHERFGNGTDQMDEFIPVVIQAENACAAICGEDVDARELIREAQEQAPEFGREFKESWAEIAPSLEGFMRGKVLHPVGL